MFGDTSERRRSALLYREIEFRSPFAGRFVYSGWWFRQKIEINGETVWFRISWMRIFRHATFTIRRDTPSSQTDRTLPNEGSTPRGTGIPLAELPTTNAAQVPTTQSPTDQPPAAARTESEIPGRVEIDFTRGLRIRRFRLWIADELVYDEIN